MLFIRDLEVPFAFLSGSSSLVLGKSDDVTDYFMNVFDRYGFGDSAVYTAWTYPTELVERNGITYRTERVDKGLLAPHEIFELAEREVRELRSKIIYFPGITHSLVREYGAQYKFDFDFMFEGGGWVGLPCWLSEYAVYADTFSKRMKKDVFLNLDWDLPANELPSLFLNTFDRIFEFGKIGKEKAIFQTRDAMRRKDLRSLARRRRRNGFGWGDWW